MFELAILYIIFNMATQIWQTKTKIVVATAFKKTCLIEQCYHTSGTAIFLNLFYL